MADAGLERRKNRSPEHPAIDLVEAISRAEALYEAEGFHWINAEVATGHLGYAPKSSAGQRILAALKHYGLLEDSGTGKDRKIKLSDLARRIIRDKREGSAERVKAIREAALSPSIYAKLWETWGAEGRLPSPSTMEYQLEHDWGFNPNAIDGFLRSFLSTIEFAGLLLSSSPESNDEISAPSRGTLASSADPITANPSSSGEYLELPIPLVSGHRAVLRIPTPLTEEDFELLTEMISTSLRVMKRGIVTRAAPAGLDQPTHS